MVTGGGEEAGAAVDVDGTVTGAVEGVAVGAGAVGVGDVGVGDGGAAVGVAEEADAGADAAVDVDGVGAGGAVTRGDVGVGAGAAVGVGDSAAGDGGLAVAVEEPDGSGSAGDIGAAGDVGAGEGVCADVGDGGVGGVGACGAGTGGVGAGLGVVGEPRTWPRSSVPPAGRRTRSQASNWGSWSAAMRRSASKTRRSSLRSGSDIPPYSLSSARRARVVGPSDQAMLRRTTKHRSVASGPRPDSAMPSVRRLRAAR